MEQVFYEKLVRDKIPDKIRKKGSQLQTRTLSEEEFKVELLKKLVEESGGVANAKTPEELASELGDVLDIIDEIRRSNGLHASQISAARRKGMAEKGGFRNRTYLIWSQKDDYNSNERLGYIIPSKKG